MADDTLIFFGDAVKAIGGGKVAGYLCRFTTAADPDLAQDFFKSATDFFLEDGTGVTTVLYNHALDPTLKARKLGRGTLKVDDVGVWIEAQLSLRDEYEKAVYELAKAGKLGWSSGSSNHLVSREKVGKAFFVKSWPIVEASLTPIPCEPRNVAESLKSYRAHEGPLPNLATVDTKGIFADMRKEREMSTWELWSAVQKGAERIATAAKVEDVSGVQVDVGEKVAELVDEYAAELKTVIETQIAEYLDRGMEEDCFYLKSLFESITTALVTSVTLEKHSETVATAVQEFAQLATEMPAPLKAWVDRVRKRIEFREAKDGRSISAANRDRMAGAHAKMKAAMDAMQQVHSDLEELMKMAEPKPKAGLADMNTPINVAKNLEADILTEAAKFEELQLNLAINRR